MSSESEWTQCFDRTNRVKRPSSPSSAAFFYFFAKDNDLEQLWPTILFLTEKGLLGHCSGYSKDGRVVCIDYSDAKDLEQKEFILNVLKRLEINAIKWKTRLEAKEGQLLADLFQTVSIEEAIDSSTNQPIDAINPFATIEANITTDNNN